MEVCVAIYVAKNVEACMEERAEVSAEDFAGDYVEDCVKASVALFEKRSFWGTCSQDCAEPSAIKLRGGSCGVRMVVSTEHRKIRHKSLRGHWRQGLSGSLRACVCGSSGEQLPTEIPVKISIEAGVNFSLGVAQRFAKSCAQMLRAK